MRVSASVGVVRCLVLLMTAALPVLLSTSTAHADDAATEKRMYAGSACTNDLVKSGSGRARLSVEYDSYVDADIDHAEIGTAEAWGTVSSCSGTGGTRVVASTISLQMRWIVNTTGIESCTGGLPAGVSCTISSGNIVLKKTATCSDTSGCYKSLAGVFQVYPRFGHKIVNVTYQGFAWARQSNKGEQVPAHTSQVTWWA